jgi:integrase
MATTAATLARARALANKKVRELSAVAGSRMMTIEDAQIVEAVKRLAGGRSSFAWLREIEDALTRLNGRATISQAVAHLEATGVLTLERVLFKTALDRFIDSYGDDQWHTTSTMRKVLEGFGRAFPGLMVADINEELLLGHLKASKVSEKTWNNRLGFWKTFLNRCRAWHYLPAGKHAAEIIARKKEPDKVPAIFSPAVASAAVAWLTEHKPYLVPTFVIGCWLGLRPISELRVIRWEHFDWERGYLHLVPAVARKTMRERFVPLSDKVRGLLEPYRKTSGACSARMHQQEISKALRGAGIIPVWPPDVMRHSYISYMLALGHGIGQVAEWAGTSERRIRKNYRRPLRKEDGELWFGIQERGGG